MSRRVQTIAADYFEDLYVREGDPWGFASSDYEREKYDDTISALPRARYSQALEVGCSIGVFTRQLASRCDRLVAIDAAATALTEARRRCHDRDNAEFVRIFVPQEWPVGNFDLIVLSEVVYYLHREDVSALAERVAGSLAAAGHIVLVHWTGDTDYPLSGDEAADLFIGCLSGRLDVVGQVRRLKYRLDVLERR